ncbi:MAG: DNA internalization-related competence protein ComEC/Rec2 [Deltaproteobacteria bacterium]|nr:DNA internalization-related competence protein ComEC/Rec2 [Deltaproteobacteria bacterium]
MNEILRLPLIPILIAYAIGLYGGQFNLPLPPQGPLLLFILLGLWILLILLKRIRWASWIALSFFLFLGLFSVQSYFHPKHPPSHISRFIGSERILLEGTIDRSPQRTRTGTQLLIKSHKIILGDRQIYVEGHLLLFLKEKTPSLHLGDRLRLLCTLHRPHGFRNPGVFSYERHLALERIHVIGFLADDQMWVKVGKGFKNPILLKIESWRDHIRDFLEKEATLPSSSIFQALVLGEQGNIPEDIRESFITTGIAHLLAISGDHLGIVALLSFSLFLWVMKRSEFLLLSLSVKKWAAGLTIPCLLLYTFIAGGGISVIRATIMVITFFFSIVFDRERHLLHTLALAALLILLCSPPSLFDVSFQLSFLAVLSILYLVPRIYRDLRREEIYIPSEISWKEKIGKYIKLSFIVTVVAILGTAPFVALHFNRVSLIGFLANLLIIPWVGFLIVPITLTASIFSFFFYPFASLLIMVTQFLATILLKVVAFFASIPFASIYLPTPTALEMILFYLLLFLGVHLRKGKKIKYLFVGICILFAADLAYWNFKDDFRKDLHITFIDVGHGDSILVEFPKGKRMLIDGGGLHDERFDIGKNVIAPFLWKKKIQRIDTLVLTHPDPDHLKGLNFIPSRFKIGRFWDNGLRGDSEFYLDLEKTLDRKKIDRISFDENSDFQVINGVEISFLNPPAGSAGPVRHRNPAWVNNQSLVMRLRFKNVILLLTGDVEREAEEWMVRKGYPLRAHLLKVPHHGSSSSSSLIFLEKVKPDLAIISVGERTMGQLPHPEVIERYKRLGSKIFRTDKHGAVTVVTDGEKVEIKTFLKGDD